MDSSPAEAREPQRRSEPLGWLALPVLAILASYAVALTGGFVWDDYPLIVNSPLITGHAPLWSHFRLSFWNNAALDYSSFYRPLVTVSYALDHHLWGAWAGGFHLTNIVLHTICALLLSLLCVRAGASRCVAALLATTFALFPRLTESVAWVSGRTDPLAGVGVLSALLLYQPGPGARAWWRRALAGVAILFGLLCKEVALAGVVALLVLSWQQRRMHRRVSRIGFELLPIGGALAVYTALRLSVPGGYQARVDTIDRDPLSIAARAGEALARYGWALIDPLRPRLEIGSSTAPRLAWSIVGVCLLPGLVLLFVRYAKRWPGSVRVAAGLGGTSVALVMHVIRLDVNVSVADRYLYLPVAALALGSAEIVQRLCQRRRHLVFALAAVIIGCFAVATSLRARTWTNDLRLWREASAEPHAGVARAELAVALMHRARYQEALPILLGLPETIAVPLNRATCLDKLGGRAEAIRVLESSIRHDPKAFGTRLNLVLLYARASRFELARSLAKEIEADFPSRPETREVVSLVEDVSNQWAVMPPEVAGEPLDTRARRAELFARIGALPEAQARWAAIALEKQADQDLRLRGASYLALFGDAAKARDVLAGLARDSVGASRVSPLLRGLEARYDEE